MLPFSSAIEKAMPAPSSSSAAEARSAAKNRAPKNKISERGFIVFAAGLRRFGSRIMTNIAA